MTAKEIVDFHMERRGVRFIPVRPIEFVPSIQELPRTQATPMPRCPKCNGSIILGPPQLRAGLRRCAIRTCFHEWEENDVVNGLPAAIHPANTAQLAEAALELELWGVPA